MNDQHELHALLMGLCTFFYDIGIFNFGVVLFLLWSVLSTCLESENKSVRSKKFGKNFKFSRVKFRKTNSNEERTVKEILFE